MAELSKPEQNASIVTDEMVERAERVLRRCWSAEIPDDANVDKVARLALEAATEQFDGSKGSPRTSHMRAAVLSALADAWERNPHERLCQLIWNATERDDPFYVEDSELIGALAAYPRTPTSSGPAPQDKHS